MIDARTTISVKGYAKILLFFAAILPFLALSACSEPLPNTGAPIIEESDTGGAALVTAPPLDTPGQPLASPTQEASLQSSPPPAVTLPESAGVETAAVGPGPAATGVVALPCSPPAGSTPSMTEGPYYKTGAPERTSLLEPGLPGTRLVVEGYVLDTNCQPIPGARLDFWQADSQGVYDNAGFILRGYQLAGQDGKFRLETVVPGQYPGRTEHIHVKVQAPNGPELTSQLFFPGVEANQGDSIFSEQLLLDIHENPGGLLGRFNFILDLS